ncbi:MAG: hypothetical protein EXR05_03245 [Acetobacteraceae bacterium]|nr:hypothetical protein [Acetobacteraceae bacterium]
MKRRFLIAAGSLVPSWALAHEPRTGPHGGVLVDARPYHVEVTVKGTTVDVYVSDGSDRPLPAIGFKATAILTIDGKPQRIVLVPVDSNRLTGQLAFAAQGALKGAVLLTAPDGKTTQAKID